MFNNLSLHSCVSMARHKLHSSASNGSKDDLRLCRWVLLKNSLTNALGCSTEPNPSTHTTTLSDIRSNNAKDVSVDTVTVTVDEADAFLFPDGDVFAESFSAEAHDSGFAESQDDVEGKASEAQWLDSLLESLSDDAEGADGDTLVVSVVPVDTDDEEYPDLASLVDLPSDHFTITSVSSAPESIHLPPSPPLLPISITLPHVYPVSLRPRLLTYTDSTSVTEDPDHLVLPDILEDSCSDTDSESLNTPFTRSTSSLNEPHTNGSMLSRPSMVHIVERDEQDPYGLHPYDRYFPSIAPMNTYEQEC